MLKFNCSKSQKKKKKEWYSCSFTINAKALCLSESQYSPRCCTVQMAGVSAYQSECYHGGREKKKLQLYMYMLFVLCWVIVFHCCYFSPPPPPFFPIKTTGGGDQVTPRSGKPPPLASTKPGTITTGSTGRPLCGPRFNLPVWCTCILQHNICLIIYIWSMICEQNPEKKNPGSHYAWPNIFLSSTSHPNKTAAIVLKFNVRQPYHPTSSLYANLSMTLVLVNVWLGTQYQRSTAWTPLRRFLLQMTSLTQDGCACIQYILALSSYSVRKWRRVFLLLMCRCIGTRRCEVHWKSFLGNKC